MNKNILHYYTDLLRFNNAGQRSSERSEQCVTALHNVIRTMKYSRDSKICGEDFSELDFGNIPLNGIKFSMNGDLPCSFRESALHKCNFISGHSRAIYGVAFSKDGKYISTSSYDQTTIVWDKETGLQKTSEVNSKKHLEIFENNLKIKAKSIAFSADGKYHSMEIDHDEMMIWENNTGKIIRAYQFAKHDGEINTFDVSPNREYRLLSFRERVAVLWNENTKEQTTLTGHSTNVDYVRFSPNGRYCITESIGDVAILWEVETGRRVYTFDDHTDNVLFSGDGAFCITKESGNIVKLRNIADLDRTHIFKLEDDFNKVQSLAFSLDGYYCLCVLKDKSSKLYEYGNDKCISDFKLCIDNISSVVFSEERKYCITLSDYKKSTPIILRKTKKGEPVHTIKIDDYFTTIAISPNGEYLLIDSYDKISAKLIEAKSGKHTVSFIGHTKEITSVAFSPDGKSCLTGSWDGTARLWRTEDGACLNVLGGNNNNVSNVISFSLDGRYFVLGLSDNTIEIRETENGRVVSRLIGHSDQVITVALSKNGKLCISGSMDATAKLWDNKTGKCIRKSRRLNDYVNLVAITTDENYCLVCSYDPKSFVSGDDYEWYYGTRDTTMKLCDIDTGDCIYTIDKYSKFCHQNTINSVDSSVSGKYMLTGSSDRTAMLWDMKTGVLLHEYVGAGYRQWVESVAISHDEKCCLVLFDDSTVRLFEIKSGECKNHYNIHQTDAECIKFSADDKYFLTGSKESAKLWAVKTGECVRIFRLPKEKNKPIFSKWCFPFWVSEYRGCVKVWEYDCFNPHGTISPKFVGKYYTVRNLNIAECNFQNIKADQDVKTIIEQYGGQL